MKTGIVLLQGHKTGNITIFHSNIPYCSREILERIIVVTLQFFQIHEPKELSVCKAPDHYLLSALFTDFEHDKVITNENKSISRENKKSISDYPWYCDCYRKREYQLSATVRESTVYSERWESWEKTGYRKPKEEKAEQYSGVLKLLGKNYPVKMISKLEGVSISTVQKLKKEFCL